MLHLEKVNGRNVWDILKLTVSESQKNFVAANEISIIEAYTSITGNGHAFPFGIYDEDKPVSYTPVVTPMNKSSHLALELEPFDNFHAVVFGNEESDLSIVPPELSTAVLIKD